MAFAQSALLFLIALQPAILSAQPAVTIRSGRISGKDLGDVQAWLGIPYAAPPTGPLRWRAPQPPASWDGMRAMEQYGDICMQPRLTAAGQSMSEDCLTLNVWAPKSAHDAAVMVWIHGGAFIEGSGAMPIYAGTELARHGVVVVTINYRLGDFGFFAHPDLSKEAGATEPADNFGFQDQIAALRWVRENISAFGGNPRNVTIFGESAGGASVNFLMISPAARGLFDKAIAESGGGEARTRKFADLEKDGEQRATTWGAGTLAAMRAIPAETIQNTPRKLVLGGLGPTIDGKYVPSDPAHAFAEGKQAPVPFLVGANSFEASLMSLFGITTDAILSGMANRQKLMTQFYGEDRQRAAQDLFTDMVFFGPARYLAAQMEKVKQPAYLYFFSYVAERRRSQVPGAQHGGEIPFVFDQFPALLGNLATAQDRKMAATVSAAWVQFAKTGSPDGPGLPEWPVYTLGTDRLLEWGTPIAVREHLRSERLDLLTGFMLARQ